MLDSLHLRLLNRVGYGPDHDMLFLGEGRFAFSGWDPSNVEIARMFLFAGRFSSTMSPARMRSNYGEIDVRRHWIVVLSEKEETRDSTWLDEPDVARRHRGACALREARHRYEQLADREVGWENVR